MPQPTTFGTFCAGGSRGRSDSELPNRPLQQPNATRVRSRVRSAATPRAAPAAPRGRGTLGRDLGRSLLNGQVVMRTKPSPHE
jgi:hypothetical protein